MAEKKTRQRPLDTSGILNFNRKTKRERDRKKGTADERKTKIVSSVDSHRSILSALPL